MTRYVKETKESRETVAWAGAQIARLLRYVPSNVAVALILSDKPSRQALVDRMPFIHWPYTNGQDHMGVVSTNPMKLMGPWAGGFVLDFHSVSATPTNDPYHPFDVKRTELGELLYRFKYAGQQQVLGDIVETAAVFVEKWNPGVDVIVPAPPSMKRKTQPVVEIAVALAERLKIPLCQNAVEKIKETPSMKNVPDWFERQRLLAEAIKGGVGVVDGKKVLLFDDLTQSGSTLYRTAQALSSERKAQAVFALVLTRTR